MRFAPLAATLALATLLHAGAGVASVSTTIVFDALVEESQAAAIVTPIEERSDWEDGRIVTWTHVRVDDVLAGSVGKDAWIRALGGTVGEIAQQVQGEAQLPAGRSYLVFLKPSQHGGLAVVGRAQGEFPLVPGAPVAHVVARLAAAALPPRADVVARIAQRAPGVTLAVQPAAQVLAGQSVQDARKLVTAAWQRTHAAR